MCGQSYGRRETHGPPRSRGRVDFFRVAGTISEGRLRYSRRNSMPSSDRNLQQHPHSSQKNPKHTCHMTATHIHYGVKACIGYS